MKESNPVVVIVGASSGNGKACALAFAKDGARLVIAARGSATLTQTLLECQGLGAEAIAVTIDTTIPETLKKLAEDAITRFGRIDVWVQNAGIGAIGDFNEVPLAVHQQVIETNLLGAVNGAYTVLPIFKKQGAGIFIATNSVGAWVPLPIAASYSASKYGLRGLIEALQGEVSKEKNIHFCEVAPAFVNTPGIEHVANYTGKKLKNPPGAADPMRVAKAILAMSKNPKGHSVPVMASTTLARVGYFVFPKLTRWASAKVFHSYFDQAEAAPITEGAVFKPSVKSSRVEPEPEKAAVKPVQKLSKKSTKKNQNPNNSSTIV